MNYSRLKCRITCGVVALLSLIHGAHAQSPLTTPVTVSEIASSAVPPLIQKLGHDLLTDWVGLHRQNGETAMIAPGEATFRYSRPKGDIDDCECSEPKKLV